MGLVVRKKVPLDFLGEGYEGSFLVFRSIPVSDLLKIQDKLPKEDEASIKAIPIILEILKEYFVTGEFPNEVTGDIEVVQAKDIDNMTSDMAVRCFQSLTGVDSNLDNESLSTSTPSTPVESPEASHQSSI